MKVCTHKAYATAGAVVSVVLQKDGYIAVRCDGCEMYRVSAPRSRDTALRELMTEGRFIAG